MCLLIIVPERHAAVGLMPASVARASVRDSVTHAEQGAVIVPHALPARRRTLSVPLLLIFNCRLKWMSQISKLKLYGMKSLQLNLKWRRNHLQSCGVPASPSASTRHGCQRDYWRASHRCIDPCAPGRCAPFIVPPTKPLHPESKARHDIPPRPLAPSLAPRARQQHPWRSKGTACCHAACPGYTKLSISTRAARTLLIFSCSPLHECRVPTADRPDR